MNSDWKQLIGYPKCPLISYRRNVLPIGELINLGWNIMGIGKADLSKQKKVLTIGQN